MTELFADTCALVEIQKGNLASEKISQEELVTLALRICKDCCDLGKKGERR